MSSRVTPLCVALGVLLAGSTAWGHGGVSLDKDPCVRRAGLFLIHFAAYQPQFAPADEYCAAMPRVGNAILVFDLVDRELRSRPASIRVVETANGSELRTVASVAARTYPSGVVNAEVFFTDPGRYSAILTLEEPPDSIEFPIRVQMWDRRIVPFAAFVTIGAGGAFFVLRRRAALRRDQESVSRPGTG